MSDVINKSSQNYEIRWEVRPTFTLGDQTDIIADNDRDIIESIRRVAEASPVSEVLIRMIFPSVKA